jgi:hypothetical protein
MASLRVFAAKFHDVERGARISPVLDFGDMVDDGSGIFAGQCLVVVLLRVLLEHVSRVLAPSQ